MVKAQLYGNGVIDYTDVKVYRDESKLQHADMLGGIIIELTKGESKLYLKISGEIEVEIRDLG